MRLLVIDHHDSYSHLLHHLCWQVAGIEPFFILSEELPSLGNQEWDAAILSPGPGHPAVESDFGATARFLAEYPKLPVLGICLGHQGMAQCFGARILPMPKPWHGRVSTIDHDAQGLFAGMPAGFSAVRYHSLFVDEASLPRHVSVTARSREDGTIQGLRFPDRPWWSLQFHPESIGTKDGKRLMANFIALACQGSTDGRTGAATTAPKPSPIRDMTHPETPVPFGAEWIRGLMQASGIRSAAIDTEAPAFTGTKEGKTTPTYRRDLPAETMASWIRRERRSAPFQSQASAPAFFYWMDPQVTGELNQGQLIPSGHWHQPRMGLARHAILLFDWGLQWVQATYTGSKIASRWKGDPLKGLQALRRHATSLGLNSLDWVGCFHYELGALTQDGGEAWTEFPPKDKVLGAWLFPDQEWTWNTSDRQWHFQGSHDGMGLSEDAWPTETWMEGFLNAQSQPSPLPPAGKPCATEEDPSAGFSISLNRPDYQLAFAGLQSALRKGDTYEACLTLSVAKTSLADPFEVYRVLRQDNPAPFGAYIEWPHATLLSSSPELFLAGNTEGLLTSKPIKGTRRRGESSQSDQALRVELAGHPKDKAENLMITDLVRNDLCRVCEPGSVQVTSFQAVEPHPHVFQMVTTIQGRMRQGFTWREALAATFPGGSMTGAPKSRTMKLLRQWEGRDRGLYSGAFGTLGADGSFQWAMTIRSWMHKDGRYSAGCGGAIVIDSDVESEWQEAWLKIEALQKALRQTEDTGETL